MILFSAVAVCQTAAFGQNEANQTDLPPAENIKTDANPTEIAPAEIDSLMRAIESQQGYKKSFSTPYYLPAVKEEDDGNGAGGIDMKKLDERFEEATRYVVINQFASTSNLQTNLSMGYARSARVMSQLEAAGIVGPQIGAAKKREVLVGSLAELEPILKSFIGN